MITISIQKPKSSQLNRVMKGCGMRVVEGDTPIQVKKELARKIKNAFSKGKAHTLYSQDFVGTGFNEMFNQAKKYVETEARQTARQVKKEAIQAGNEFAREAKKEAYQIGRELKKEAYQQGNVFLNDVAKPYLSELVSAGIVGLGGAAAVVQPELAPFIGMATIGATTYANSLIDSIGRPRKKTYTQIQNDYDNQYQQQIQAEDAPPQPIHEVLHTAMASVSDSQQGLIGFGLRNDVKKGNGLYGGGGLYTQGRGLHPSQQQQDATFYLNRNILPAYIQNEMYSN